jgi:hypothetical protein
MPFFKASKPRINVPSIRPHPNLKFPTAKNRASFEGACKGLKARRFSLDTCRTLYAKTMRLGTMEPNPPPIFTGAKSKIKRVHNLRTALDHMVCELVGFAGAALRVVFPFDSNSNSMVALIFIGSLHNQCALSLRLTDILKALEVFPGGWLETRHKHSDRTSLGLGLLACRPHLKECQARQDRLRGSPDQREDVPFPGPRDAVLRDCRHARACRAAAAHERVAAPRGRARAIFGLLIAAPPGHDRPEPQPVNIPNAALGIAR